MRADGRLVLALSGRTKAGKSTIARALGERLGWPWASFGDYVREAARRTSRTDTREGLQELGRELIADLGWKEFCRRTLAHGGLYGDSVPCIVEGVRHLNALTTLRDLFLPAPVYLVHLDVADEARDQRLETEGIPAHRGAEWEQHSTERDVHDTLPARAQLRVSVDQSPEPSVSVIIDWLYDA